LALTLISETNSRSAIMQMRARERDKRERGEPVESQNPQTLKQDCAGCNKSIDTGEGHCSGRSLTGVTW